LSHNKSYAVTRRRAMLDFQARWIAPATTN